ncbi:MAG: TonB-dependent receptor [Calditrichaeota bacterium]|nr:TonB-dependent receptor [Calditrichota bacterium]
MLRAKTGVIFAFLTVSLVFLWMNPLVAQTTGKIVGRVVDQQNGQPLPGANVLVEGTTRGAAADTKGNFFIINLPPGVYTLRVQMLGYETVRVEKLRVSVNRTTNVTVKMKPTVIKGQVVVVEAPKVAIKKDQTSSVRNVSSDEIKVLPVENVSGVIGMQAGVVQGHFRGGRLGEVAYMVDGVQVTNTFSGTGRSVDLEPDAIKDLEVITGTFNAEYGKAMSGVVNLVTKEGGKKFHGAVSASLANYFTQHKDIFIGLKDSELDRNQDYKIRLSGPIWKNRITFFTNARVQDNKNYLNGIRRFHVWDYSYFSSNDSTQWYSEHTGDNAYVPMNRTQNKSFFGKITAKPFANFKTSLLYTYNKDNWHTYNHEFKYDPDGMGSTHRQSHMISFHINHMLSPRMFYELKLSSIYDYTGWYVFKNPFDPRYVNDRFLVNDGPGFYTGGQQKNHTETVLDDKNAKLDLTWQVTQHHSLKTGVSYVHHDLDHKWFQIRNYYAGTDSETVAYKPVIFPDSSIYTDIYHHTPYEFSSYIQDKMEFQEMVINIGVRLDYFNPNSVYPSQRRNPANRLRFPNDPSRMSKYLKADPKWQVSPRFGLSYQLGKAALLHFSYGHFFQMPPMYAMYQNHSFRVAPTNYTTVMGNAQIHAQKTVQYEVGLWQELARNMGLEVTLFYRDIYDLLTARIITTYNQIKYGLYDNKDYGNARGLEIKYDYRQGPLAVYLNYTLQYTRGNADNPTQTFTRAGNSMDPVPILIPMSWDQRHTLNVTVGYNTQNYGATVTAYYNSGTPYTWTPIPENPLSKVNLYPNNAWKPSTYNVDLNSFYTIKLRGNLQGQISLHVYNLLDRLNEVWVNNQTGRAYTAIVRQQDILRHRSNFNTYMDRVHNPAMFSAPRLVKLGFGILF